MNLDGGKIVTVQKAKKDGEKSTKVTLNTMMITTMVIVIMNNGHSDTVPNQLTFVSTKLQPTGNDSNFFFSVCQRDEWDR